jgi:hypothetical protein
MAEPPGGDYRVARDDGDRHAVRPARAPGAFVPSRGVPEPSASPRRTRRPPTTAEAEAPPALFFAAAALAYPLLHPNWMHWIGLSLVTLLAAACIGVTVFVGQLIVRFGAVLSVFGIALMALACLALVSYLCATLVHIVIETAAGADRLHRLPGMSWDETLGPFLRMLSSLLLAAAPPAGATWLARHWIEWTDPRVLLGGGLVVFQCFPVWLIAALVDQSVLPLAALGATLRRLALCSGSFVVFLVVAAIATVALAAALYAGFQQHVVLGGLVCGPAVSAWLMFYAHWLGRLCRALSEVE